MQTLTSVTTQPQLQEALSKSYRAIIFDWNKAVVTDSTVAIPELVYKLQGLLEHQVVCAILTDENYSEIDFQCIRYLSPQAKQNLYIINKKGTEAYRYSKTGSPIRLKEMEMDFGDQSDLVHRFRSVILKPQHIPSPEIILFGDENKSAQPDSFLNFLSHQLITRGLSPSGGEWESKIPTPDPAWLLEQEGFDPSREREMESLFSIGNGAVGVRGSLDSPIPSSQADLYIAGVYSKKSLEVPYSEVEFLTPDSRDLPYVEIVPFPFPFRTVIKLDDKELRMGTLKDHKYERILDLKKGILFQRLTFKDQNDREIAVYSRRCTSLHDHHLLLQEVQILFEDSHPLLASKLAFDLSLTDKDFHLNHPHLLSAQIDHFSRLAELNSYQTQPPSISASFAVRIEVNGKEKTDPQFSSKSSSNDKIQIRRMVTFNTTLEGPHDIANVIRHALAKEWNDFDHEFQEHSKKWDHFWKQSDCKFQSAPQLTEAQRFNIYQLRIPADHNPNVSIGAKGLTGRAYEGHIFWDTEIFILPFFIYTQPDIARCLLMYRHNTLRGAKARAQAMGLKGACYAWESTVTGADVTPTQILLKGTHQSVPIYTGTEQIHTSADIVYGISKYWDATHDHEFLTHYGAEIIIETARFWADRVTRDSAGSYHLENVVGPDEYHFHVTDNAYTNWMARFNLRKAVWVTQWMKENSQSVWTELSDKIRFEESEVSKWENIASNLIIPTRGLLIEQFKGFFDLKEVPIKTEERMKAPFFRLLHWHEINHLKIVKQADVLMLPFLFPEEFSTEQVKANYEYYEPLTDHGSSLSPSIHAAIAAQIGNEQEALKYWNQSLHYDLLNLMKNTALGIHEACIGGAWQALVFHLLGIRSSENGLQISSKKEPILPPQCESIQLQLNYQKREYPFLIKRPLGGSS